MREVKAAAPVLQQQSYRSTGTRLRFLIIVTLNYIKNICGTVPQSSG